jgi:hypothetical protein
MFFSRLAVSLAVVLTSSAASAVTLRYTWKPGATQRFTAHSTDHIRMSGMGVDVEQELQTDVTFGLKIDKVTPQGVAHGQLIIESFSTKDDSGRVLAGLDSVPKGALRSLVEIDRQGNFKFKEVVYLVITQDGATTLVSGTVGPHSATASATAGDEQVTVYAEFDPKTGALKGGYDLKKVAAQKKRKKVAVKQDATKVDLLPTQLLELLRLPEGDVTQGSKFSVALPTVKLSGEAVAVSAKAAEVRVQVSSAVDTGAVERAAAADAADDADGDDAADEDDDAPAGGMAGMAGMPGMEGMPGMAGLPGMGGGAAGGAGGPATAKMKVDGDFTTHFDVAKGMLQKVEGTLNSQLQVGGMMTMTTASQLSLRAL